MHVLIAGCGIAGLTVAQGCRRNGIPYTIFEKDASASARTQGWSLTLHFGLEPLERMIGPELSKRVPEVSFPSGVASFALTDAVTLMFLWQIIST